MQRQDKEFGGINWRQLNDVVEQWLDLSNLNEILQRPLVHKTPLVNVWEDAEGLKLKLAAPGLKKEDFNLEIEQNLLYISAQAQDESAKELRYSRREFDFSNFKRSFRIGERFDTQKISAKYEHGELLVSVPLKEPQAQDKVRINVL